MARVTEGWQMIGLDWELWGERNTPGLDFLFHFHSTSLLLLFLFYVCYSVPQLCTQKILPPDVVTGSISCTRSSSDSFNHQIR